MISKGCLLCWNLLFMWKFCERKTLLWLKKKKAEQASQAAEHGRGTMNES